MATTATPATGQPAGAGATAKQQFLDAYEKEHVTTMRVLRAFPSDKADLRPDPSCRTARELAWIFVMERGLGTKVFQNVFASGAVPRGELPQPPESWDAIVAAFETAHKDFVDVTTA